MSKKPSKEEFVLDGPRAYHGPTGIEVWYAWSEQQEAKRSLTYRPGVAGEYDEGEVVKLAGELLYVAERYWKCPLCGAEVDREHRGSAIEAYEEHCKLKEHSVGYECIAFRQEGKATELLAGKGM